MTGNGSIDRERASRLMMAALDGEITSEERRELDRILEQDPEIREEWNRMGRVKEVTSAMRFKEPPEEVWGEYWTSVYNRTERGIGWILLSLGTIVLTGYVAWQVITQLLEDTAIPAVVKLSIFAVALGLIVLLVSVTREKLFTRKHDAYKEIER